MGFITDPERPWLGGACEGGDPATYYPELWNMLVTEQSVKTVIDVGCGEGIAVRYFEELGCAVRGIDGIKQNHSSIGEHDYTLGPFRLPNWASPFDLCWCCEFVEHVEEQFVPNFLATFACCDLVLMTHAWPNQDGHHHVNCQTSDYWKGAMAAIGYQYDYTFTQLARAYAAFNKNPWNHFTRSGMAFRKPTTKRKKNKK